VFDGGGIAQILKALGEPSAQAQPAVDLAQEKRPAITAEFPGAKIAHDFSRPKVLKKHRRGETLCLAGVGWRIDSNLLHTKY
jgi:hypothetical protein